MDVVIRAWTPATKPRIAQVAALRRLHLKTRESGVRDFETGALLTALIATGELSQAGDLYSAYVRDYRRVRLPMNSILREAATVLTGQQQMRFDEASARQLLGSSIAQ